jgi:hypothetical protein
VIPGLLALFLVSQYAHALTLPFVNDDYLLLDQTRTTSCTSLWDRKDLLFGWYRPWSREFHYWTLQRLFGTSETPFHVTSFVLWLCLLSLYFNLVRRLAGQTASAIATVGLAGLALWGAPLLWVAGAQDLWALLFAMVFLHFLLSGSWPGMLVSLGLGLLSKESTVVLPGLAVAYFVLFAKRSVRQAVRETLPLCLVVIGWAILHPTLSQRFFGPLKTSPETTHRLSPALTATKTLLAQVNLDAWPRPVGHLGEALTQGVIGATIFATLVWLVGFRGGARKAPEPRGALLMFGSLWAVAGWSILFMPSIGWHPYYGVLGSLGAWLVLGIVLSPHRIATITLVACLALLRSAMAFTLSWDWGTEWYQHRAGSLLRVIRDDLTRRYPTLPPHSRVYFAKIPNNIGLLAADGPSLRVWYGDSTLRGRYYSEYTARPAGQPSGSDFFFVFDSTIGLVQIRKGHENLPAALRENPHWEHDHEVLADMFVRSGELRAAAAEYGKLAQLPGRWDNDVLAGVSFQALGDSAAAESCYRVAAAKLGYPLSAVRDSAQPLFRRLEAVYPRGHPDPLDSASTVR